MIWKFIEKYIDSLPLRFRLEKYKFGKVNLKTREIYILVIN
jgi:hypothetical protein